MSHVVQLRMDGRPGDYFTWDELTRTGTGLPNVPGPRERTNLLILTAHVLDPLRRHLGRPVRITSGFRSNQVNQAVGGSLTSAHKTGEAADLKVEGMTAAEIVEAIKLADIDFDQVIAYAQSRGGHVHIGIKAGASSRHRHQLLWAPSSGGYEAFR